jgi:hypothetical protein
MTRLESAATALVTKMEEADGCYLSWRKELDALKEALGLNLKPLSIILAKTTQVATEFIAQYGLDRTRWVVLTPQTIPKHEKAIASTGIVYVLGVLDTSDMKTIEAYYKTKPLIHFV